MISASQRAMCDNQLPGPAQQLWPAQHIQTMLRSPCKASLSKVPRLRQGSRYCWCTALQLTVFLWAVWTLQHVQATACTPSATYTACPTALEAAQFLTGGNILLPISNAVWNGPCNATTKAYIKITSFGCHYLNTSMSAGALVLSNGDGTIAAAVSNIKQSNTKLGTTVSDADLSNSFSGRALKDIVKLTFDVTPAGTGGVAFQYVFGSEEYPEFAPPTVSTGNYSDVFAFYMWKTSVTSAVNIALLPNSSTPVSIDSVNPLSNTYYVANDNGYLATELDGFTKLLSTTTYSLTAGVKYTVKLVIADVGDQAYDSVVWVKAGSLNFNSPPVVNCAGNWTAWSACNQTCGGGVQTSTYSITIPASNGGINCSTANNTVQTQSCNTSPCPVNCVGAYSNWTTCNKTCGGGYQTQTYVITTAAAYGGTACSTTNGTVQTQACNTSPCPINCVGSWSTWSTCNKTCGGGSQRRKYTITTAAAYGGTNCTAANNTVETQACNTSPCPINCTGAWSSWSTCNQTCGSGSQTRTYTITVAAAYGGTNCTAANNTVDTQTCNTTPCPINCVGSWSSWSACNKTCGGGYQTRTYTITTAAAYGGTTCNTTNGSLETTSCNTSPCPVNCVGGWTSWSACNKTCGGGNQTRQYIITTAAAYGGTTCSTTNNTIDMQACNTSPCPVNCVASWSPWSTCNQACGWGSQSRQYTITTAAAYGGTACAAANNTVESQACIISPCAGDCVDSYTNWTACNATCGGGNQSRTYIITAEATGGTACTAANNTVETRACNTSPCPVDCVGSWGDWSACNQTCGGGSQTRYFTVTTAAAYGGTGCSVADSTADTRSCNVDPCPIDCVGDWSAWSACNETCGSGSQTRTYLVTTEANYNGTACNTTNGTEEVQSCNTDPCPIDCVGDWSTWSACNQTCGGGSQTRTYLVTTEANYNGTACNTTNGFEEAQSCNISPCPIDCVGDWSAWSACNATCNGRNQSRTYVVTTAAAYNGTDCPETDGTVEDQACNTQACSASPEPDSPSPDPDSPSPDPDSPSPDPDSPSPDPDSPSPEPDSPSPEPDSPSPEPGSPSPEPDSPSPEPDSPSPEPDSPSSEPDSPSPEPDSPSPGPDSPSPEPDSPSPIPSAAGPSPAPTTLSPSPSPSPKPLTSPSPSPKPSPSPSPAPAVIPSVINQTELAEIPYYNSPPVLPPLPPLEDTNITIRGGNVTITGVKIESVGATLGAGNSSSSSGTAMGSTLPQQNLKLRWAAFNGSLGFYTLGVNIMVYGEFVLQRTMNWTWDSHYNAWTTQVSIQGTFLLTREEQVNGVMVGSETLNPSVSGLLNLFSAAYPGPGFSGTYDWAGDLDMVPDPFAYWGIHTLVPNSTARRRLAQQQCKVSCSHSVSSPSRLLLQSSAGNTPVQGRVSVREVNSKPTGSSITDPGSAAGTQSAIDDEISAIVPSDGGNVTLVDTSTGGGLTVSESGNSLIQLLANPKNQRLIVVIAAIVAPSALALCAVSIIGAVLYRKKKRRDEEHKQLQQKYKEQQEADGLDSSAAGDSAAAAGATATSSAVPSRKGRRRKPTRSDNGRGPAELESLSAAGNGTSAGVSSAIGAEGTVSTSHIEFLDPSDAGQFASFTGYPNLRRTAHIPLSGPVLHAESEAGEVFMLPAANESGSGSKPSSPKGKHMHKGRFGSITGSIAGIASGIAGAISHLRSSQAGQAYRVAGPGSSSSGGKQGRLADLLPEGRKARQSTLPGTPSNSGARLSGSEPRLLGREGSLDLNAYPGAQRASAVDWANAGVFLNSSSQAKVTPPSSADRSRAAQQQQQQQFVPSQWILPALNTGTDSRNATWATGIAAAWATEIKAASRGSTPTTAAGLEELVEKQDEVVTTGSTFLLPSRARRFGPAP